MTPQQQQNLAKIVYELIDKNRQDIQGYERPLGADSPGQNEYVYFIRQNSYHVGQPSLLIECKVHSAIRPQTPTDNQITYCLLSVRYKSSTPQEKRDLFHATTNTQFAKEVFCNMQQSSKNSGR